MEDQIIIKAKDIDLSILYVYSITRSQAFTILEGKENEVISIGEAGEWIKIGNKIVSVRKNTGGRADLDKENVFTQIKDQIGYNLGY
jgi:hypothetical protein